MTEQLPDLPFQSHFTQERFASVLAHRGALHGVNERSARELAVAWMLIYDTFEDARIAIDGGPMADQGDR